MKLWNSLNSRTRETLAYWFWMLGGNIIFAIGVNVIITPVNLYNGGFMGMAQLLRLFCISVLGISLPAGIDLVGIIYFCINIPLFVWAYIVIGREYCVKSIIAVAFASVTLAFVPVAPEPIVHETITACLIGGVVAGTGAGMVLRSGSASGGQDIVGVILSKSHPNVSVGFISIIINTCVFTICFFIFDIEVVIYSLIYTTVIAIFLDRAFIQNINVQALIFSKSDAITDIITRDLSRGVTVWKGEGGYTHEDSNILCTIISKYEVEKLRTLVKEADPNAFIIINEGIQIHGTFIKRLTR